MLLEEASRGQLFDQKQAEPAEPAKLMPSYPAFARSICSLSVFNVTYLILLCCCSKPGNFCWMMPVFLKASLRLPCLALELLLGQSTHQTPTLVICKGKPANCM